MTEENKQVHTSVAESYLDELERTKWKRTWQTIKKNKALYFMILPMVIFLILFKYLPITGIIVAFKDYSNYGTPVSKANFAGFYSFYQIMFGQSSADFWQAFRNTFTISFYGLIFGFPIPILLALMFSEIKNERYRSITQILSYLPKFISTVVTSSIILLMMYNGGADAGAPGLLANLFIKMGVIADTVNPMSQPGFFRPVYIISGIWEGAGYGSIVYFAAIMAISPTYYEAAKIDGANKLAQIRYVTLPGMAPTLTIMLILRIGSILNVGYEQIMLLYNRDTYVTADVISTFVMRQGGVMEGSSGTIPLAAAADLFNSLIAMALVLGSNFISRKVSDTSLF